MLCVFLPLSGESWLTHTPHLPCWGASTAAPPFPFLQMEACLFPFYVEFQQTHNFLLFSSMVVFFFKWQVGLFVW